WGSASWFVGMEATCFHERHATLVAKRRRTIRCAKARRTVIPDGTVAEIGFLAALAGTVAAGRDVEQRRRMLIDGAGIVHRAAIGAEDAANQRCRDAGATEDQPRRYAGIVRTIYRNTGRRIGNRGHIRFHAILAALVGLPFRLRKHLAAAAAGAAP